MFVYVYVCVCVCLVLSGQVPDEQRVEAARRLMEQSDSLALDMERLESLLNSRGFQAVLAHNGFGGMNYEGKLRCSIGLPSIRAL